MTFVVAVAGGICFRMGRDLPLAIRRRIEGYRRDLHRCHDRPRPPPRSPIRPRCGTQAFQYQAPGYPALGDFHRSPGSLHRAPEVLHSRSQTTPCVSPNRAGRLHLVQTRFPAVRLDSSKVRAVVGGKRWISRRHTRYCAFPGCRALDCDVARGCRLRLNFGRLYPHR